MSGGGFAAALAAKGQSLKAAPEEAKKPTNSQSDLLQQIRSGISLKNAQQQVDDKKKEAAPTDNSVASILARRIALADSDSDDEDSEEEWSD
jgi:methylthioribose-1-phosphate isomerase